MLRPGKKTAEELRRVQELRRSSAATPVPSRKHYSRKKVKEELRRENGSEE